MSTCYIYDGSFEGLLTAVYEAYYGTHKCCQIIDDKEFCYSFLMKPEYVETNVEKSNKVYEALKNKISSNFIKYIFYVFLSDVPNCSSLIYEYIKLGFKLGKNVDMYLHDERVLEVHNIVKKVAHEYYRMLGFVRFKTIDEKLYYAAIKPDHNIILLITPHFTKRLASEKFIIHDVKRNIATIYNGQRFEVIYLTKEQSLDFHIENSNDLYEVLWRDYFKSASVENRRNEKLQRKSLPKRYWEFLTEIK